MTSNEIWLSIYDKGLNGKIATFSQMQKHLYYYIDFITHCEMEGVNGFLYNKSPSQLGENDYQPYIDCWRFFNYDDLAKLVEEYNNFYLKAIETLQKGETMCGKIFSAKFELVEIENNILIKMKETIKNQDIVWKWIEDNINLLIHKDL
jgi:hypothetical protein